MVCTEIIVAEGTDSTVGPGHSDGSTVGVQAGFFSTKEGEEKLFLPPRFAKGTDDLSGPETAIFHSSGALGTSNLMGT